jgi:dipeptidyl aminopeptidase/acylaminoacyl peptidase
MITNDAFERKVSDWLHADAEHRIPDHLDAVLRLTSAERQRPAWSSLERWLPVDTTFAGRLAPPMRPAWPLIVVLLLAVFAAAIVFVGTRQRLPAPYGPADNGSILYSAHGDIFIANLDGSASQPLIGGPDDDVAPVVSHDGTRFVWFRKVSIDGYVPHVANFDGTDVRVLTERQLREPSSADWSPDGTQILVLHKVAGKTTASIVAADGSRNMDHLELGAVEPESPMWRPPDGREIVFRGASFDGVALYAIGADNNDLRRIAPLKSSEGAMCLEGCYLGLRLSPDGTRVTFWHNMAADLATYQEGRKSEVHVLDLRTGEDFRIGYDPKSRHELLPKFSPDGESVLFVRFPVDGDAELLIAAADGSDVARQIGPSQRWGSDVSQMSEPAFEFSPDGRKIILASGADRRMQVIDIASGNIELGEYAEFPAWQRVASRGPGQTPCPGAGGCQP